MRSFESSGHHQDLAEQSLMLRETPCFHRMAGQTCWGQESLDHQKLECQKTSEKGSRRRIERDLPERWTAPESCQDGACLQKHDLHISLSLSTALRCRSSAGCQAAPTFVRLLNQGLRIVAGHVNVPINFFDAKARLGCGTTCRTAARGLNGYLQKPNVSYGNTERATDAWQQQQKSKVTSRPLR